MGTRLAKIALSAIVAAALILAQGSALSSAGSDRSGVCHPSAQAPGSVVINEFVASNQSGLQDEDGDYGDWIELYNPGAGPIDLAGWSLSDDPGNPGKWLFPARTPAANSYL